MALRRSDSNNTSGTSLAITRSIQPGGLCPPACTACVGCTPFAIEEAWRNGALKYRRVGMIAFDPTFLRIGNCGLRVDISVLALRESRLIRCTVPGCRTSYEIPDAAPAPPKTSVQQFLDSLVPLAYSEHVTEVSMVSKYTCSSHPRVGSHCAVFEFLGRTEREFYSVKHGKIRSSAVDRGIHFQDHLSRARFRIGASAELRHLIRPDTPPEFLPPTPEELIRLRAASEEYDRRVRVAQERMARIRASYQETEQQTSLDEFTEGIELERRKLGASTDQDTSLHNRVRIVEFKFRPTAAQTAEWERKLRKAFQEEYGRDNRDADVMMSKYIAQLQHERETATHERQIEIDQHMLHVLRSKPFHPAKPRYAREIKLIEDEVTIARAYKIGDDPFKEEQDVFEQIVPNYVPTRTKTKAREPLERIQSTWFEDTKARLARFNKQKNDPEALRKSADFKKLLGATLVLNEDMTTAQAELLTREPSTAIEKRAQRLRNALHPEEMKQVA